MSTTTLNNIISEIIARTAQEITVIVRSSIIDEIRTVIDVPGRSNDKQGRGGRRPGKVKADRAVARPTRAKSAVAKSAAAKSAVAKSAARVSPKHCIHPECTKPHKGPRFSFLCAEHVGVSKTDKHKYLAAWKAEHKTGAPEKEAAPSKLPRRNRSGLDEDIISRVLKVVEEKPGLRSEEIQQQLPVSPELVKKALAKLREDKRVKTTGEKRGMTYLT